MIQKLSIKKTASGNLNDFRTSPADSSLWSLKKGSGFNVIEAKYLSNTLNETDFLVIQKSAQDFCIVNNLKFV